MQSPEMFVITVWKVTEDSTPSKYTVTYPPLERYVKECSGVAELRREHQAASDRYAGKENTIVTSNFAMSYAPNEEPKIRGIKQWWAQDPIMSRKA